jgi:hypothetical protein
MMNDRMQSIVQLADGTVLNCQLNGTEYETEEKVDASIFTDKNLASVTIDGEVHKNLVLNSTYDFGTGSRFSFREMTEDEKTIERLNAELTQTQVGLTEVFETLIAAQQDRR